MSNAIRSSKGDVSVALDKCTSISTKVGVELDAGIGSIQATGWLDLIINNGGADKVTFARFVELNQSFTGMSWIDAERKMTATIAKEREAIHYLFETKS